MPTDTTTMFELPIRAVALSIRHELVSSGLRGTSAQGRHQFSDSPESQGTSDASIAKTAGPKAPRLRIRSPPSLAVQERDRPVVIERLKAPIDVPSRCLTEWFG